MDAEEIIPLTAETVVDLVRHHRTAEGARAETGKRRAPRGLFPGAVQLWVADNRGAETLIFGTCCNVSRYGLGVRTDLPVEVGVTVPVAIHLPQASYHGKATVRHCTAQTNAYFVGMEFHFA